MRIKIISLIIIIATMFGAISCGNNTKITKPITSDVASLATGTEETFDIITWNIENFPKAGSSTLSALLPIIPAFKVECIAIQEVTDRDQLNSLISQIPGWKAITTPLYYGQGMALLYDTTRVQITDSFPIYTDLSSPFPRSPLVCKALWQGQEITVIVNHLKAMGDNVIDLTDPDDDEYRRLYACQLLNEYVRTNLNDQKVIILGDMNDQIQEPDSTNVFTPFLHLPDEYLFTDMPIATNLTPQNCSYPGYTSQIDHILISNELFEAFDSADSYVRTIPIDHYIAGGWEVYDRYISDHRPVGCRFRFGR